MSSTSTPATDDRPTVIAISALTGIIADVLHEGLGHGVTAWLSGAHRLTISTVALQSDISTRWISANGTLVNLLSGFVFWFLLLRPRRYGPALRYFLVLSMASNLFVGTGYFFFSGVTNFGDWSVVINGWQPHWVWQLGLVLLGAASYYASMMLVASHMKPFKERLRGLCWTPYFTDAILAFVGGLFNPVGLFFIIASALPATLGANAGLLALPGVMHGWKSDEPAKAISRSIAWISAGAVASAVFIFVLGRGISWSR